MLQMIYVGQRLALLAVGSISIFLAVYSMSWVPELGYTAFLIMAVLFLTGWVAYWKAAFGMRKIRSKDGKLSEGGIAEGAEGGRSWLLFVLLLLALFL